VRSCKERYCHNRETLSCKRVHPEASVMVASAPFANAISRMVGEQARRARRPRVFGSSAFVCCVNFDPTGAGNTAGANGALAAFAPMTCSASMRSNKRISVLRARCLRLRADRLIAPLPACTGDETDK